MTALRYFLPLKKRMQFEVGLSTASVNIFEKTIRKLSESNNEIDLLTKQHRDHIDNHNKAIASGQFQKVKNQKVIDKLTDIME